MKRFPCVERKVKSQPSLKSVAGKDSSEGRKGWGSRPAWPVARGHGTWTPLRKDGTLSDLPTVNTRFSAAHLFPFCKKYQLSVPFLVIHTPMYFVFVNFILLFIFFFFYLKESL